MYMRPFHLAIPVPDLQKARHFYGTILGCPEGRSDDTWIDFDFFGHQLVFHLNPNQKIDRFVNPVDSHPVPLPHFGVILNWQDWEALAAKIQNHQIEFVIKPYVRFKGEPGEQATMFFYDSNGLSLEFKAFKNDSMIFEK
ncbi:MAG TPA: VOC family protein [Gammaproteobacteria bacterium]|nr:VOC family protein [Gammaproteobacteria bacterium]